MNDMINSYYQNAKHASVYLPGKQVWYDLRTGTAFKGGKTHKLDVSEESSVPAFQRAGTIIPRKDCYRRSSTQMVNDPYTLVIALNSSQATEDELYVDDGETFKFMKGAYIHRRFIFSNGKLTSINLNDKSEFFSTCVIERIILLGYSPGPKSALVEPGKQKVEIELGPLRAGGYANGASFVSIRKPMVRITDDWTIKVL